MKNEPIFCVFKHFGHFWPFSAVLATYMETEVLVGAPRPAHSETIALIWNTPVIHVADRDERRSLRVAYNSIFRKLWLQAMGVCHGTPTSTSPPNMGGISRETQEEFPRSYLWERVYVSIYLSSSCNSDAAQFTFCFFSFSLFCPIIVLVVVSLLRVQSCE